MSEIVGKISQCMTACRECHTLFKYDISDIKQEKVITPQDTKIRKSLVELNDYIICPRCGRKIMLKTFFSKMEERND